MVALPKTDDLNVYWSNEDNCFLCQSNEHPDVVGIGNTKDEAIQIYYELLENYLDAEKKSRLIKNKGGRPKKSNTKINYNVSFNVRAFIELEAIRNDVNQGVMLEKIVDFYQKANKEELSKYYDFN